MSHILALQVASGVPAGQRLRQLVSDRRSDPVLVSRQPWLGSSIDEHLRDPQCDLFAAALAVRDVVERHVPAAHVSVRRLCSGPQQRAHSRRVAVARRHVQHRVIGCGHKTGARVCSTPGGLGPEVLTFVVVRLQ